MNDLTQIIKESFTQYSGAVLQSRALVDVRDCLKPSARQIYYCLYTDKFTYDKPYKKTLKAVGSLSRMYIHGDSSAVGVLMRSGQHFALHYPLADIRGNAGTLIESGDWAPPRYTETRLSELTCQMFNNINKDTIDDWRDNYDNTEKYPSVLPSNGFYNIVNGSIGLGIGMSSSIPQYNIKDVNTALIHLLYHPDCDFEEIYCAPDFATGGTLVNEAEVKESMKNGTGKACKLRAKIEWDAKARCLCVVEMPYAVYTDTIVHELNDIIEGEKNPGIDNLNNLTGATANIKIYLNKRANPSNIIKFLYKNTSLESHYGINMIMLKDGRYPRVFTWKEALQSYLDHQLLVYRRAFEYDKEKAEARLHIVEGLLIALANINEIVRIIKQSESTSAASLALQKNFNLTEVQAKAILDIKLSRLAHLEVQKLEQEKFDLCSKIEYYNSVLEDEQKLKGEIEKDLRSTMEKFGDERRTQILNTETEDGDIVEEKGILISLTNHNNLIVSESSSLYTARRGSAGIKVKLKQDEYIVQSISTRTTGSTLFVSDQGRGYTVPNSSFPAEEKINVYSLLNCKENENIIFIADFNNDNKKKYLILVTKKGMLKKTLLSDYKRISKGAAIITLNEDDSIVSAFSINDEKIASMSETGHFIIFDSNNVNAIGRVGKGVKVMNGTPILCAAPVPDNVTDFIFATSSGIAARIYANEFTTSGRATKGLKTIVCEDNDKYIGFVPVTPQNKTITFVTRNSMAKMQLEDFPTHKRNTGGVIGTRAKEGVSVKTIIVD